METYKEKEYASGFPPSVQTEEDKINYANQVSKELGVEMDPALFQKNPALRTFSKFKINNFCKFFISNRYFDTILNDFRGLLWKEGG